MLLQMQAFFAQHIALMYMVVLFPFGACVGSFLNVVICRLPHELSLLDPPSSCPKCGRRIFGLDNLPILSWIILGGKCRQCRAPISWRYPGIELLTACLWAALGYTHAANELGMVQNIGVLVFHLLFVAALIAASFIDFDYQIIPDEITLGGLVAALAASAAFPALHPEFQGSFSAVDPHIVSLLGAFAGAAAGAALLLLLTLAGTLAFRKQIKKAQEEDPDIHTAIGLGDTKLMAFVGAALGWQAVPAAFFVGTLAGAIAGIVDKLRTGQWPADGSEEARGGAFSRFLYRWRSGNSVMPYGPFLSLGALVLLFFHDPVIALCIRLFLPFLLEPTT